MLRRSLQVFLIAALAGLLLTVLYAVFALRGPADLLREAASERQNGNTARAITLLDLCAHSADVQRQPELRRQLLRQRYTAHLELTNHLLALRDLEALLAAGAPADETMQLDRIRLLALQGRGAEALELARAFLGTAPAHGRALELAGEACQVAYAARLRDVTAQVRRDVGPAAAATATTALLAWLYRPEGDPGVQGGLEQLRLVYSGQVRLSQAWDPLHRDLIDLRRQIQEGLDYHRRALEAGGEPVAAFLGMSFALQQAGRTDDLVALCETYRHRFAHVYVTAAVEATAAAHLRDGLPEAAIDAVRRWFPAGSTARQLEQGRIDAGIAPVLTTLAFAHWRRQDVAGLQALTKDVRELLAAGLPLALANHCTSAFVALLKNDDRGAEANLRAATELLRRQPAPRMGADPLAELMPLRLQLLHKRGAKDEEVLAVFDTWIKAREGEQAPRLARVHYLLSIGKVAAAYANAIEAQERAPQDEEALRTLAAAAAASFQGASQDGPGLMRQCRERKTALPEVPHPICLLLCAETALAQSLVPIAQACAEAAVDRFPWARWPRLLLADALAAGKQDREAAATVQRLLASRPDDPEALARWLRSRRSARLPIEEQLFAAACTLPADPGLAEALLRRAVLDDPAQAVAFAGPIAADAKAPAANRALAARAFAAAGELERAAALLATVSAADANASPAIAADLVLAELAMLRAQTARLPDPALTAAVHAMLQRRPLPGPDATDALLATAAALADSRPQAAMQLWTAAMTAQDAEQLRTATTFQLGARLALGLGQLRLAEDHWFAALGFPDGDAAVEPLTRLLLLRGQEERALQVYRMASTTPPTDAALAFRCGNAQVGQRLLAAALAMAPGDVRLATLHGLTGPVAAGALGHELRSPDERQTHRALELLSALGVAGLADAALARARALVAARPDSNTARLLLARALLGVGKLAEAAEIHAQCHAAAWQPAVVLAEIAHAVHTRPDYPVTPELQRAMRAAVLAGKLSDPTAQVVALRGLGVEAAAAGNAAVATQMFAEAWLRQPRIAGAQVADALNLHSMGRSDDALTLLVALLPEQREPQRLQCIEALFAVAGALLPIRPALQQTMRDQALAILASDGAVGAALHFLLALPERPGAALAADTVRDWLLAHLVRCARGQERWALGLQSLQLLQRRVGVLRTLELVDGVLRDHPAAVPLWIARARLLAEQGRPGRGLVDLRRLLAYVADPDLVVAAVTMAAENRALVASDDALLAGQPKAALASPAGAYARGLLALRRARAKEAADLLASCPPEAGPIWFRALAELTRTDRRDTSVARSLLQQLARDHASSSLARYAGSLARQLGPN